MLHHNQYHQDHYQYHSQIFSIVFFDCFARYWYYSGFSFCVNRLIYIWPSCLNYVATFSTTRSNRLFAHVGSVFFSKNTNKKFVPQHASCHLLYKFAVFSEDVEYCFLFLFAPPCALVFLARFLMWLSYILKAAHDPVLQSPFLYPFLIHLYCIFIKFLCRSRVFSIMRYLLLSFLSPFSSSVISIIISVINYR